MGRGVRKLPLANDGGPGGLRHYHWVPICVTMYRSCCYRRHRIVSPGRLPYTLNASEVELGIEVEAASTIVKKVKDSI